MKRHTMSVRRHTYRGQDGWLLSGRPPGQEGGWPLAIFFDYESAARRTFREYRDGLPVTDGLAMFAPDTTKEAA